MIQIGEEWKVIYYAFSSLHNMVHCKICRPTVIITMIIIIIKDKCHFVRASQVHLLRQLTSIDWFLLLNLNNNNCTNCYCWRWWANDYDAMRSTIQVCELEVCLLLSGIRARETDMAQNNSNIKTPDMKETYYMQHRQSCYITCCCVAVVVQVKLYVQMPMHIVTYA